MISDYAKDYRTSRDFRQTAEELGVVLTFIRPRRSWTDGDIERLNRTLAAEWAYSRIFASNTDHANLSPIWLAYYHLERPH